MFAVFNISVVLSLLGILLLHGIVASAARLSCLVRTAKVLEEGPTFLFL